MSWNCEQTEARLSDYVDHLLGADEQREFTAHTASCARCARLTAQVGGFVAQLRRLEPLEEPPRLVHQILDQTLGPRKATGWQAILEWLRPMAQPRFALSAVATLMTVMVVSQALGLDWSNVDWKKDLAPANVWRTANSRAHLVYARGVKFVNDLRVVYEIQTRLQTPQEPAPAPQKAPGSTEAAPDKREKEINRADELKSIPMMLASTIGGVPGRSIR